MSEHRYPGHVVGDYDEDGMPDSDPPAARLDGPARRNDYEPWQICQKCAVVRPCSIHDGVDKLWADLAALRQEREQLLDERNRSVTQLVEDRKATEWVRAELRGERAKLKAAEAQFTDVGQERDRLREEHQAALSVMAKTSTQVFQVVQARAEAAEAQIQTLRDLMQEIGTIMTFEFDGKVWLQVSDVYAVLDRAALTPSEPT